MPFLLNDRLRDALDGITVRSSFAGGCQFKRILDPQILVGGVGRINLPLSDEQAQQMISRARLAPYRKSSETVVDTTVRNTWKLDPQDFKITAGATWDEWLDRLLKQVAKALGVTEPIHAELHKMLLYEKGAMFKAHTDTEKAPHMFGTLVISLPSPHQGGDVVVRHHDQRKVLNTSKYELAAIFWYSDISHEVLPVKAGYRWVLTYNLATIPSPERPLGGVVETGNKPLREVMTSWARGSEATPLYYALEHKYTQANISLASLKARDHACVEELEKVSRDLDFHIFLATLEREDTGDTEDNFYDDYDRYRGYYNEDDEEADDDDDDDNDDDDNRHHAAEDCIASELTAKLIYDLHGNEVMSSVVIDDERDILQEDPFADDLDEEDSEGHMGNYGPQATHRYRLSAVVIVPPKGILPFLTSYISPRYSVPPEPLKVLNYCVDRCQSSDSKSALDILLHILQKLIAVDQARWASQRVVYEKLYQLAMTCNKPELLDWILGHVRGPVPLTILNWSRKEFEMSTISFRRLSVGVPHAVLIQKSLNERYQAILAFHGDSDPNEKLLELLKSTATKAVDQWQTPRSYEDGLALFDLVLYSHDDFLEVMKSCIIPKIIESCGHLTAFMFGFVHKWDQSMRRKQMSVKEAKLIYESLVRVAVEKMKASSLITEEDDEIIRFGNNQDANRSSTMALVSYQTLRRFAVSLFKPGLEQQRNMFIEKIYFEAKSFKAESFKNLWIPLLQDWLFGCEKYKIFLSAQGSQQLYQAVLEAFIVNYVGTTVHKLGLARKPVSCPCWDCKPLNQFLVSPTQLVGHFCIGAVRRQHLMGKLKAFGVDCTYKVEQNGKRSTLVVTKTEKQYESQITARHRRKLEAAKHLCGFDQEKLRTVLADRYEAIMLMKMLGFSEDAATGSVVSSPAPRREPLAPISTNPVEEIARLEAEMERLVNNTPSSAPTPTKPNATYGTPTPPANPSWTSSRGMTAIPTGIIASPQSTRVLGTGSVGLSKPLSSSSLFERVLQNNSLSGLGPTHRTMQHPSTGRGPPALSPWENHSPALGPPVTNRAASNPSRPPPTWTIPHPVAGSKRKFVELVDLTLDDD